MTNILPQEAQQKNRFLAAALWYVRQGYSVIPLQPRRKKPLIEWRQYQEERAMAEQVKAWWQKWPNANVGIVTGEVSGVIVLDVDGPEGEATLRKEKLHIPATVIAKTGGGGWHYLFKHPGFPCHNFAGKTGKTILPHVDFRGDGGYIVAPPSLHESGNCYEWAISPREAALADPPEWLFALIRRQAGFSSGGRVTPEDWRREIPEGERNTTLARLAGSLLSKGNIPVEQVILMVQAVNVANCKPPLERKEVEGIVKSIAQTHERNTKPEANQSTPDASWPDPEPINSYLLPVENLPPEIIPGPLRAWAVDVAHRMQCSLDFIAVAVVVMAGAVIGAGCGIRPKRKDDWLVVPNLWGGVVGRPGTMKTPALQEALKPLAKLEAEAKRQFDEAMKDYEAEKEIYKAQKEALKNEMLQAAKGKSERPLEDIKLQYLSLEKPQPPTWRRYKTNDATIEKMAELLQENPRGILLFRDELIGLLTSWDKEGREPDRAFYLESWNGYGAITVDRIGRGTVHCDNLCVSILGGVQPAKLLAYLHQAQSELENDGLMQRMQLLVYPDEPADWKLVDEYPDQEAKERAYRAIKTLAEMDFTKHGAKLGEGEKIPYFHFDNHAQRLFYVWLAELQSKLQADEPPVILEHLNKYRSLMPSLALIDHLVNMADGTVDGGDIPQESAKKAAAWCDYLESHARRIYGMLGDVSQRAAVELAKKLKARKLQDGFTLRDVYRNGWHLLNAKEAAKAACDELVEAGWLKEHVPSEGKTRVVYFINPKIFPGCVG